MVHRQLAAVLILTSLVTAQQAHALALPIVNRADADSSQLFIKGANLGSLTGTVSLGGQRLTVSSWSPTDVVAALPSGLMAASYLIIVTTSSGIPAVFEVTIGGAGMPGPAGPKGDTGPAGVAGATGPAGVVGPMGSKGDTGPAGAAGVAGPAGDVGPAGAKGDTGATGQQGLQGPVGATGPQGIAGPDGAQGPAGAPGSGAVWAQARNGDLLTPPIDSSKSLTLAAGYSYWISARVPVIGTATILSVAQCWLVENDGVGVSTVLDSASVVLIPTGLRVPSEASLMLGATITIPGTGTVNVALRCVDDSPGFVKYTAVQPFWIPSAGASVRYPMLRALRVDTLDSQFSFPPL